jgi:death-on-curing protein
LHRTAAFSTAWRRTTGERALTDADEVAYISLDEALVLYAEIKGLAREAVDAEIRDIGLLDSALARPAHAAHYAAADLAEQAATLVWGIAENQALIDGNKRLALVVTLTFLEVNGLRLEMSDDEKFQLMIDISGGTTVAQVAKLFRQRMQRLP